MHHARSASLMSLVPLAPAYAQTGSPTTPAPVPAPTPGLPGIANWWWVVVVAALVGVGVWYFMRNKGR